MRFCTFAMAALLLGAGCQGNGGAVSVRWRIVDLSSGEQFDPSAAVAAADGSCCLDHPVADQCAPTDQWVVRHVAITLADPATGAPAMEPQVFDCRKREVTTQFDLTPGTYSIGLSAEVTLGNGMPAPSATPPSEVRTIVRGEVVNLQVIEIGVHPLPTAARVPLPRRTRMVTF